MTVNISEVLLSTIQLTEIDCENCTTEIKRAIKDGRKIIFLLTSTKTVYYRHYFYSYLKAKNVIKMLMLK